MTLIATLSMLTAPADDETWSVAIFTSAGDYPLKRLRDAERWTALIGACARHAHWLDGEPITDVMPMGGVVDPCRRLNGNGRPTVTGAALLADAGPARTRCSGAA